VVVHLCSHIEKLRGVIAWGQDPEQVSILLLLTLKYELLELLLVGVRNCRDPVELIDVPPQMPGVVEFHRFRRDSRFERIIFEWQHGH